MSTVTATISGKTKDMDANYQVLSIDIAKEVNRIPYAQIVLLDGDAAKQKFVISDDTFFEPGQEIEIKLRYEGAGDEEISVFKGLVVRQAVEATEQGLLLSVEMKDDAIKLTQSRRSEVYQNKTDSDIIGELIDTHKLTKGTLAPTQPAHPQIVQYYCTDWDFMLSRADIYGMLLTSEAGKISLSKITLSGQAKHTFEFGISEIYNFELEVDATHQRTSVESVAWDVKEQKLTQASKAKTFSLAQGNLKPATLADAVGGQAEKLSSAVPLDNPTLQAWADGIMIKSRISMIRGRVSVPGFGDIQCLDIMEIAGVGKRFNGKTLVTGIRHRVDQNGWQTDVQFGLAADRFITQPNVMDAPAAGHLPGVHGLQIGVVLDNQDPDKEGRVKLKLPGIGDAKNEIWARLASPDAGKGRGFYFRPEPEDEVIVGFFNDDPRQAVILGAMFSAKNTAPDDMEQGNDKNALKGIVTRGKVTLGFIDDDKPAVFIETPGKNKIIFDDDGEVVQISDQHNNSITMNKDGIEIKSAKDLKIEASGNVEIKGSKVDVK